MDTCWICTEPLDLATAEHAREDHSKPHFDKDEKPNGGMAHAKCHDAYDGRSLIEDPVRREVLGAVQAFRSIQDQRKAAASTLLGTSKRGYITADGERALVEILDYAQDAEEKAYKELTRVTKEAAEQRDIIGAMLAVNGVGPVSAGIHFAYLDIDKAQYPSSFVAYVGMDKPAVERYTDGKASGGNKFVRTAGHTMISTMYRLSGKIGAGDYPYIALLKQRRALTDISNMLVIERKKGGKKIEIPWRDTTKSHRHQDSIRIAYKRWLIHFHVVWSRLEGRESKPWIEARAGHKVDSPSDYGWPMI